MVGGDEAVGPAMDQVAVLLRARRAKIDDALEAERADLPCDLDIVVVHRDKEFRQEFWTIDNAERLSVRFFRLQIRVADRDRDGGIELVVLLRVSDVGIAGDPRAERFGEAGRADIAGDRAGRCTYRTGRDFPYVKKSLLIETCNDDSVGDSVKKVEP